MHDQGDDDRVLATLPDGVRVVSTLLTRLRPPVHVYRVLGRGGSVLQEFVTLVELFEFLGSHLDSPGTDRDG